MAHYVWLQVREVELSMDMASILRLLDFLEALFNGGSDFNEPLKRCLNRLTDAKWANSDILLVSGVHTKSAALMNQRTWLWYCFAQSASCWLPKRANDPRVTSNN
jgi:uncharacterized protein with von Willebrand factor type A (vWA) domain